MNSDKNNAHKQVGCLNCGASLSLEQEYCGNCGQANTDFRLSTKELFMELFRNILNLDSRLAHSIYPFLFKPGFLPKAFMGGKRRYYVHPVRFYLFSSLFFFFLFSVEIGNLGGEINEGIMKFKSTQNFQSPSQIKQSIESTSAILSKAVRAGQVDSAAAAASRGLLRSIDSTALYQWEIQQRREERRKAGIDDGEITLSTDSISLNPNMEIALGVWLKDQNMTAEQLLDSLNIDEPNWLEQVIAVKALELAQVSDPKNWIKEVIDNIPIMMFFLLPIFAAILKLLYLGGSKWYIDHLIFTFHIHAFVYIVLGTVLIVQHWLPDFAVIAGLCLLFVYPFLMFRNFYQQPWWLTLLKYLFIGWLYSSILGIAAILEMLVSLLLL